MPETSWSRRKTVLFAGVVTMFLGGCSASHRAESLEPARKFRCCRYCLATYNSAQFASRYRLQSCTRPMKFIRNAARNFGIAGELVSFVWSKRWWLVPVIVTLFLLAALIALAQSSAIAPFIYTVF